MPYRAIIPRAIGQSTGLARCLFQSAESRTDPDIAAADSTLSRHGEPAGCGWSQRTGFRVAQSVEDVSLQRSFRDVRVIKIVFRDPRHPETLHEPARTPIGRHRQGDDLGQPGLPEAVIERRLGGFGRVATAPIRSREPPGHLDRRGEMRLVRDRLETDDTNEARFARNLDDPLTEPVL